MRDEEERMLAERRRYRDAPGDIQPLRDVDIKELDLTLFREIYLPAAVSAEVLAENSRTLEEQMASLRLVDLGPVMATIRKKEQMTLSGNSKKDVE